MEQSILNRTNAAVKAKRIVDLVLTGVFELLCWANLTLGLCGCGSLAMRDRSMVDILGDRLDSTNAETQGNCQNF